MEPRMNHPALVVPGAMQALQDLDAAVSRTGLPARTLQLVHLRVSQINGCSVCCDMHPRIARKEGETDTRLFAVAAWRDAPYFTDAERVALALAEDLTRTSDRGNPVSDELWAAAREHYDETALAALVVSIGSINIWNRMNVATRQVAGAAWQV